MEMLGIVTAYMSPVSGALVYLFLIPFPAPLTVLRTC